VVGIGFFVVLAFTAYARHGNTNGTPSPTPASPQFTTGSCVVIASGPVAATVPCDQPSSGRIAAVVDSPRPCPQGTAAFDLEDGRTTLCLTPP
jgi:hypothetical protein